MPGQASDQTEVIGAARAAGPPPGYAPPPMPPAPPTEQIAGPPGEPTKPKKKWKWTAPLSIFLILIIVFALVASALVVAELIVRDKATNKIAAAAACETKDSATAKFGVAPLVLWQLATKHFTNITVETAGNQVRDAKGMKLQLSIKDVQIKDSPDSKGTVGSINATVTWTTDGIRDTIKSAIPILGPFVSRTVTAQPNDGTVEMKGLVEDIVAKPVVSDGVIKLQIVTFNTLGGINIISKESAQSHLDKYTADVHYPLGIKADKIEVTPTSIVAQFSAQNATIPANKTQDQDPCFQNL